MQTLCCLEHGGREEGGRTRERRGRGRGEGERRGKWGKKHGREGGGVKGGLLKPVVRWATTTDH